MSAIDEFPSPLWIAYEAGNGGIADGVERIRADLRAAGAPDEHVHAEPGSDHSIGLVEGHPDVQRFLVEAVRSLRVLSRGSGADERDGEVPARPSSCARAARRSGRTTRSEPCTPMRTCWWSNVEAG